MGKADILGIERLVSRVTPAICFNNTTSLPLLLLESLSSTGILERLTLGPSDTSSEALARAKSYLLVNAIVGNSLTFALGPRLLDSEHAPDNKEEPDKPNGGHENDYQNGDVEHGQQEDHTENDPSTEETSLLPNAIMEHVYSIDRRAKQKGQEHWLSFKPRTRSILELVFDFFNPPLIGAIIGALIGLAPPLHKAFFSEPNGTPAGYGIFTAWLTSSLQNIGDLFASLQVVVVGVSLASSLRKAKRGEDSGPVPWIPSLFVLFVRFVFWPVVGIAVVWAFLTKTSVLGNDPMLWFTLMLMPIGPSAMKLVAMADVYGADESEKMSIAKFLTLYHERELQFATCREITTSTSSRSGSHASTGSLKGLRKAQMGKSKENNISGANKEVSREEQTYVGSTSNVDRAAKMSIGEEE
ncbi:MAG: hypothetical protein Q9227_007211 [Pyrenula ochraceoflavens]